MRQRNIGKRNGFFSRTKRVAASLLVAGIMTLSGKAGATDSRPLKYRYAEAVTIVHLAKVSPSMQKKIKEKKQTQVFKSTAAEYLKMGGKLNDIKKIAKPFKRMTEEDHAVFRQPIPEPFKKKCAK